MNTLKLLFTDRRTLIGTIITALVVLLAVFVPWLAPYGEYEIVGKPFTLEGSFLGTDYLGQDVLSRVLYGGQSILITAILATVVGLLLGVLIGVTAAYVGGWLDEILMRLNDVLLAFPQILVALLVLSAVEQPRWWMLVLIVGISRPANRACGEGVALTFVQQDFYRGADAIGGSVGGSSSRVGFQPRRPCWRRPAFGSPTDRNDRRYRLPRLRNRSGADWGQMTNENRLALLVTVGRPRTGPDHRPFTVGTNLIADGIGQRASRGN